MLEQRLAFEACVYARVEEQFGFPAPAILDDTAAQLFELAEYLESQLPACLARWPRHRTADSHFSASAVVRRGYGANANMARCSHSAPKLQVRLRAAAPASVRGSRNEQRWGRLKNWERSL